MKCPDCGEKLIKKPIHAQGVWLCSACEWTWFMLKLFRKPPTKVATKSGGKKMGIDILFYCILAVVIFLVVYFIRR